MEMLAQIAKASTYSSSYTSPYKSTYSSTSSEIEDLFAGALGVGMMIFIIVLLLFAVVAAIVTLVGQWKMFKKAGKDGYIALIPVYNVVAEMEMAGLPLYFWFVNYGTIIFSLIPFIGGFIGMIFSYVFLFIKNINLAKSFGKGTGFGVLMVFFPFVVYPMLGFGKAEYIGPQYKKS